MLDIVFNIGFGVMVVGGMGFMVWHSITNDLEESALQRTMATYFKRFRRVSTVK